MINYIECLKTRLIDGTVRVKPELFLFCLDYKDAYYYDKNGERIIFTEKFIRFNTEEEFRNAELELGKVYAVSETKTLYNNERYILNLEEELLDNDFTSSMVGGILENNGVPIAPVTLGTSVFHKNTQIQAALRNVNEQIFHKIHGVPFAKPMKIYAGTYDDIEDASIVIVTAGANQKPGETRLDLVKKNISIFKSIIPEIKKRDFNGLMLIVSNPVDILTYVATKLSGFPANRVIGSGTVLDTARLKYAIGEHLNIDSRSVHAFIIGEHGDSEMVAWNSANVSGIKLDDFCEMRGHYNHKEATEKIANDVKNSAYEIISKKKATYYGIAMSVKRICEAIVRDEKSILPISSMMNGEYGINDVALSMPSILGKHGFEEHVPIDLSNEEIIKLKYSAKTLKEIIDQNQI